MSKWEVERSSLPSDPADPRGRRMRFAESAPAEVIEAVRVEVTPGGALVFSDEQGDPVTAFGPTAWATMREYVEPVPNPNVVQPPA